MRLHIMEFENGELKFTSIDRNAFNIWEEARKKRDMVDSPAHYTHGRYEAIEVIEDAIDNAPSPMQGFLQGQVLKYMLRLWHKIDAKEDAEKARWYLNKLIDSLD